MIWLLRLLSTRGEVFGGRAGCQVGSQTVRLTIQLARLLGSAASASTTIASGVVQRRSSNASPAELTWDDLVVLFAADVHTVLGTIEEEAGLPVALFFIPSLATLNGLPKSIPILPV